MLRTVVLACVLAGGVCVDAVARMYQWQDTANGAVQLSGEPPSWYRSGRDGPRVLVFERGFLVDDTNIEVSLLRRLALRKQAFDEIEERRALADLRALQEAEERKQRAQARAEQRAERREAARAREKSEVVAEDAPAQAPAPIPEFLSIDGVARLKALISAFDQIRQ